jgi:hypothetical protein
MPKEVVDFLINRFQILPQCVSAYGCHPQGTVSALYATQAVFCVMCMCRL